MTRQQQQPRVTPLRECLILAAASSTHLRSSSSASVRPRISCAFFRAQVRDTRRVDWLFCRHESRKEGTRSIVTPVRLSPHSAFARPTRTITPISTDEKFHLRIFLRSHFSFSLLFVCSKPSASKCNPKQPEFNLPGFHLLAASCCLS